MRTILFVCLVLLAACAGRAPPSPEVPESSAPSRSDGRFELRVAVYPYVPGKNAYFEAVSKSFESRHPSIKLELIDLTSSYYDEDDAGSIVNATAHVYELDSNFLFTDAADAPARASNLAELRAVLSGEPGRGLLIDLKGRFTLGGLSLDAVIDHKSSLESVERFLVPEALHPDAVAALKGARELCEREFCRNEDNHDQADFYARQFAERRGRALAGYSEVMYFVGHHVVNQCRHAEEGEPRECVSLDRTVVKPLAHSEQGARPFVWVDSLTISSLCTGECLAAAAAFIAHVTSESEVLSALLPQGPGELPRYLLPALSSVHRNEELKEKAPLYGLLLSALEGAVPAEGTGTQPSPAGDRCPSGPQRSGAVR